eukprot:8426190-Karenia_brevis.AAC.1
MPSRTSEDQRGVSSHGHRLLQALAGHGLILNGLESLGFDKSFTRLPRKHKDCPGVLDYVIGSPSILPLLQPHALKVLPVPPD